MTVSEQLRQIARDSGLTNYRIGMDIGMSIRTIDRFITEGKPAHTDTFDALCKYFGLELCGKKPETTGKQARKKRSTRGQSRKKWKQ